MDSRATPDPEVGREAIFDTDTEIGIDGASTTYATEPISDPVSTAPGLPDFTAIIMAEIAAAEAANEISSARGSPIGAGELVLTARELAGISQRQLAARLHTSQPTIAIIESGNRIPTIRTLMRVAQATGFELVLGLRPPSAVAPRVLGALVMSEEDGLADYFPLSSPSLFEGPPGH